MLNRNLQLDLLRKETFDLCIIGGGSAGAGCALDAALRGIKVALIERTDFAAETSGKSTKLVHGGVRYLEQAFRKLDFAQLNQVKHGLQERRFVLHNAPHLARPLALATPVFNWWTGIYYFIGLKLYDWFAPGKSGVPPARWVGKRTLQQLFPGLSKRIHSAVLYYDGQLDDARYNLALVQSASNAGAIVANYSELTGFSFDDAGSLESAFVRDRQSGEIFSIRSRLFLNCTGPAADSIRLKANPSLTPVIRPSKGAHIIVNLPRQSGNCALLIPKTADNRMAFAIPFEGKIMIGTTDEPCERTDNEPFSDKKDMAFLLETINPYLENPLTVSQVTGGFAGLRPLVSMAKKDVHTKTILRDHLVEYDEQSGLVSLLGGKWTTYRLMAKDAVDLVALKLNISSVCSTENHLLWGANGWTPDFYKKIQSEYEIDEDVSQHLADKYGTNAALVAQIANTNPALKERLVFSKPFLKAEVVYAVRYEMALEIRDFLSRRIRIELSDTRLCAEAAPEVARIMADELGWSPENKETRLRDYLSAHFFTL
jgi:glycerol-3-phosphate dehydrogenase